jgi:hypothetical protein
MQELKDDCNMMKLRDNQTIERNRKIFHHDDLRKDEPKEKADRTAPTEPSTRRAIFLR